MQLFGEERCIHCQRMDYECWVFTVKGRLQVANPGSACTRCRTSPGADGCSLSNRRPRLISNNNNNRPRLPPWALLPKG
ncbi:hypothetical protein BGW36DRAFT_378488 [Talaromyces proteolyticus]|uniref:Uncharacterized protein n=1 Tax=Talaromyces proteolyticus TaxID=1131652 RepID=A0AAD4KPA0_9EURO|nr:uncharacterized protein BGW36DRAFT_378488 [Talaromyces proteolyticus]KAH8697343.1 hypothetical protein BGW36DRAFT_378488 [Talaromyces proteolyticus]